MTTVEVLVPLRLETRFVAPQDRLDGVPEWQLRLRVWPDDVSIRRTVPPPSPAELDRLAEALAAMSRADRPLDEAAAFALLAGSVGAARAFWLWRTRIFDEAGGRSVDRTGETDEERFAVHGPAGLPDELEVWLVRPDGTSERLTTLALDLPEIGADLDLRGLAERGELDGRQLPHTWWLSYERAKAVQLGIDLDVGPVPPEIDALVVVGRGDVAAADLFDEHLAGGRMGLLLSGTPTNTVEGEPTTDFGDDADRLAPLLAVDAADQPLTREAVRALTGGVRADAPPLRDAGDPALYSPGQLAVQAFWPVLWGRLLRHVVGLGEREPELARWAITNLAPEGPRPAIRIDHQPYGLLPTSSFDRWKPDGDVFGNLESQIVEWARRWRDGAAAAAVAARNSVHGADTERLLAVLGLHAPSRHWRIRPVGPLAQVQAARIFSGMRPLSLAWDRLTAESWTGAALPADPFLAGARSGPLPGEPLDREDSSEALRELLTRPPEPLYYNLPDTPLGLVGHLFRETMIELRALLGAAWLQIQDGLAVDVGLRLDLDDERAYAHAVMQGTDPQIEEVEQSGDTGADLADRFWNTVRALEVIVVLWDTLGDAVFRGVLAALDTAAFRADPWLTGVANRRLETMIWDGAAFRLGAYGWVDAPAPYTGPDGGALAPGPTAAGLLHAPSTAQALTSALLRDAAVRHPGDDRWNLTIDSARARAAAALAERVRLGVHPYEALGLEVERLAGDWDAVRLLRETFPLGTDDQARRTCDGHAVLAAARAGKLPAPLPGDLADRLAPLDEVLDTYADLLVTDGVHALVTGRPDLANQAMEAAAGLGAPSDLRAIRTPRAATTVHTGAMILLPPEGGGPADHPVVVADPAFAALVVDELGGGGLDGTATSTVAGRHRLSVLLGGGEEAAPLPTLSGGREGTPFGPEAADALLAAVVTNLRSRLAAVRARTDAQRVALVALDPGAGDAGATLDAVAAAWAIDLSAAQASDPDAAEPSVDDRRVHATAVLAERLADPSTSEPAGAAQVSTTVAEALRVAVRMLVGRPDLPVLPLVARALLPPLNADDGLDATWLEIAAAVRTRLAPLEARQLAAGAARWPSAIATGDLSGDPWTATGPVLVAFGPAAVGGATVAIAQIDAWAESVPSRRHVTNAAFGFNSPKARAPQAILLAVPADRRQRADTAELLSTVLETRELARARAARPTDADGLPFATPAPIVRTNDGNTFLEGWPP